MGVSGAGKSTVGDALARALGWRFVEGDAFHGHANRDKMAAGIALGDADRWPWLDAIGDEIERIDRSGAHAVLACSALRRRYRDRLRRRAGTLRFVLLRGSARSIGRRLAARAGHYMPASLLASQLDTLEPPAADEAGLTVDVDLPIADVVDRIVAALDLPRRD